MKVKLYHGLIEYRIGNQQGSHRFQLQYDTSIRNTLTMNFGIDPTTVEPKHLVVVPMKITRMFPYLIAQLVDYVVCHALGIVTKPFGLKVDGTLKNEYIILECVYIKDEN